MAHNGNAVLREWVRRTGWSHHEVARRVIAEAEAQGLHHVRPTHTNVRTWLAGAQPRRPVPAILAEVVGRHFGIVLTAADLDLDTSVASVLHGLDLPWRAEPTVEATEGLTKADLMISRREAAGELAGIAVGAALLDPLRHWLTASPEPATAQVSGSRIGMGEVAEIEQVTTVFRGLDNRFGAGMRRKAVIGQLSEVNDLVANATYTAPIGRRLRTATADLAGLAAWMSFDAGHHTTAQRYFTVAIHHAHDADNPALVAYLMCDMAQQMNHLGRPQDGLELVKMAQYGTRHDRTPKLQGYLAQIEAASYAHLGDARMTHDALARAEDGVLNDPSDEPVPDYLAFATPAALVGGRGSVLTNLALHQHGAEQRRTLSEAAVTLRIGVTDISNDYARTRARYFNDIVAVHQLTGDYAEAATVAEELAARMEPIRSQRTLTKIARLRARLGTEPKEPHARELAHRLDRIRGKAWDR